MKKPTPKNTTELHALPLSRKYRLAQDEVGHVTEICEQVWARKVREGKMTQDEMSVRIASLNTAYSVILLASMTAELCENGKEVAG